ncbi:glycosyltransferase family 4 protein [Arcobacter sp. LA11]|uniref:glycosyltransferase family 4 protein n=1 Tax=Arcobacter sp. LA11 TaxID=1898176 RepID=UPI0009342DA3|nr:glycosyltransferase family 4 protein [Arcobacter sp. LA11]
MINKNILEVCLSPDLGGLELYMCKCSERLSEDFNVISVIGNNSKLEDYYKNTQSQYYSLKRKSSFSLINAIKLSKIIDSNNIDIIHLHWTKDLPIVVLAKVFSKRKPKVVQSRHMTMTRFKDDFYHKFLYKNIDLMIAVTKELERQLIKFIPDDIRPKIKQVYLGAQCSSLYSDEDINSFKNSIDSKESFVVGLIGRINEFKGQYLLIEAMNKLKEKDLNIKAFFVGHPMKEEYLVELKEKVKSYSLNEDVKFLGFTNEPHKFMQTCDVVIMASKNETFGLVTIEAMQMGTVVIGANAGGVLEIIDDNENGLLFESQNSTDLADKIEKLYFDNTLKEKLAKNGQKKANESFNNDVQFDKIINIFKSF